MTRRDPRGGSVRLHRLLLATAVLLPGCGNAVREPGTGPTLVRMTLERTYLTYGPLLLAHSEGFFADEALKVEFLRVDKADEALPALVAGEIDVLPGVLYPAMLSAIAQGALVRIVSDKGYLPRDGCTSTALVVGKNIPVQDAAKQVRRISVSRAGPSRYFAARALATVGLGLEQLETIVLPPPVVGQALRDGSIDAAVLTEPWLSRFREDYTIWMPAQLVLPEGQTGVLIYGERLLSRDRETGVRFMRAFRRGVARYSEGKTPRNLDVLARETGQDRAVLEASCWPRMRPDGQIHLPTILDFQEWSLERGFTQVRLTAEQLWDPGFLARTDSAMTPPPERE